MIKSCEKVSKVLIRDFGEVENLQVSLKGPTDFVSNADINAEKIIIDESIEAVFVANAVILNGLMSAFWYTTIVEPSMILGERKRRQGTVIPLGYTTITLLRLP